MSLDSVPFGTVYSFARSSSKNVWSTSGYLTSVAPGLPPYDVAPVTALPTGLLLEGAATNAVLYSNDLSHAASINGVTVTTTGDIVPDGSSTGQKIMENSAAGAHLVTDDTAVATNVPALFSTYVKAAGRNTILFKLVDASDPTKNLGVQVTGLDGSSPTLSKQGTGAALTSSGVKAVGNGWFRVWFAMAAVSTNTSTVNIQHQIAQSVGVTSYTGDGASGLLIWGRQLEASSALYPSSLITTTGAAATRAADALYESPLAGWFNPSQGTLLVHANVRATSATASQVIIRLDDGTDANKIVLSNPAGTANIQMDVIAGGVSLFSGVAGTITAGTLFLLGASFTNGAFAVSLNGAAAVTGGMAGVPTGLTRMIVGADNLTGLNPINGWVKRVGGAGRAYVAADLVALTVSEAVFSTL